MGKQIDKNRTLQQSRFNFDEFDGAGKSAFDKATDQTLNIIEWVDKNATASNPGNIILDEALAPPPPSSNFHGLTNQHQRERNRVFNEVLKNPENFHANSIHDLMLIVARLHTAHPQEAQRNINIFASDYPEKLTLGHLYHRVKNISDTKFLENIDFRFKGRTFTSDRDFGNSDYLFGHHLLIRKDNPIGAQSPHELNAITYGQRTLSLEHFQQTGQTTHHLSKTLKGRGNLYLLARPYMKIQYDSVTQRLRPTGSLKLAFSGDDQAQHCDSAFINTALEQAGALPLQFKPSQQPNPAPKPR